MRFGGSRRRVGRLARVEPWCLAWWVRDGNEGGCKSSTVVSLRRVGVDVSYSCGAVVLGSRCYSTDRNI